jgi:hypothetical protein
MPHPPGERLSGADDISGDGEWDSFCQACTHFATEAGPREKLSKTMVGRGKELQQIKLRPRMTEIGGSHNEQLTSLVETARRFQIALGCPGIAILLVDQPGSNWALGFDHRRTTPERRFSPEMTEASAK